MSTATIKRKTDSTKVLGIEQQVAQAKSVLRQLRDTLENFDDRNELVKAKKKNAGKPGTDWETTKKELGLKF